MNEIMQKTLEYLETQMIEAVQMANHYHRNFKKYEEIVCDLKLSIDMIRKQLSEKPNP